MSDVTSARVAEQAQALADTVRNGIWAVGNDDACAAGSQALDGLLSVVATLQQERDEALSKGSGVEAQTLADTVRDALTRAASEVEWTQGRQPWVDEALTALDGLVAAVVEAQLEWPASVRHFRHRAEHAEAELVAVRERETRLREALEAADREASIAHDAIWSDEVSGAIHGGTGIGVLHDNDREDSAQSAIWRLHTAARAALVVSSPPPGERAALEASDKKPSDAGEAEA